AMPPIPCASSLGALHSAASHSLEDHSPALDPADPVACCAPACRLVSRRSLFGAGRGAGGAQEWRYTTLRPVRVNRRLGPDSGFFAPRGNRPLSAPDPPLILHAPPHRAAVIGRVLPRVVHNPTPSRCPVRRARAP